MQWAPLCIPHLEIHTTRHKVGTNEHPNVTLSKVLDGFVSLRGGGKGWMGLKPGKKTFPLRSLSRFHKPSTLPAVSCSLHE